MIGDALEYPRRGENWLERLGIGGGLLFLSFIIPLLPQLVVLGHAKRVAAGTVAGERVPPEFGDWEGLFFDGLLFYAVTLVYTIVPTILLSVVGFVAWFLFIVLFGAVGAAGGGKAAGVFGLLGTLGFVVLFGVFTLAFTAIYYFVPAALVHFSVEDDIGAAFDVSTVKRLSFDGRYFRAWLAAFGIGIGASVATTILAVTIVGLLAVPFLQFFVQMAAFYLFGNAYAEVMDAGPGTDPVATPGAAADRY